MDIKIETVDKNTDLPIPKYAQELCINAKLSIIPCKQNQNKNQNQNYNINNEFIYNQIFNNEYIIRRRKVGKHD